MRFTRPSIASPASGSAELLLHGARQSQLADSSLFFDYHSQQQLASVVGHELFFFRPGDALASVIFTDQNALMSEKALTYNYRRQVYEKRLTRYFSWQWRIRASTASYCQPYRTSTSHAIRLKPTTKDPKKCRTRLESSLGRLKRDGVIAAWKYTDTPQPSGGRNQWVASWLARSLVVEPPDKIKEHYLSIERTRKSNPHKGRTNKS